MDRQTFTREYLERLVASDPETQTHFSKYFGDLLTIKLRSRVRSWSSAEDLKQETLLRVFQYLRRDGLQHPERLGAFVNTVCNNVLFEFYRSGRREAPWPEEGIEFASESPGPERTLATKETEQQVRKLLETLPSRDRAILQQIFLADRDKDEICSEYGVDRNYLRVLLHRALQRMKKEWSKAATLPVHICLLLLLFT